MFKKTLKILNARPDFALDILKMLKNEGVSARFVKPKMSNSALFVLLPNDKVVRVLAYNQYIEHKDFLISSLPVLHACACEDFLVNKKTMRLYKKNSNDFRIIVKRANRVCADLYNQKLPLCAKCQILLQRRINELGMNITEDLLDFVFSNSFILLDKKARGFSQSPS